MRKWAGRTSAEKVRKGTSGFPFRQTTTQEKKKRKHTHTHIYIYKERDIETMLVNFKKENSEKNTLLLLEQWCPFNQQTMLTERKSKKTISLYDEITNSDEKQNLCARVQPRENIPRFSFYQPAKNLPCLPFLNVIQSPASAPSPLSTCSFSSPGAYLPNGLALFGF